MNNIYFRKRQAGAALIVSMFIAMLMLLIGVSLMRGNNLIERIVGNTREKQRALQSAQDALKFGENWIATASAGSLTPVAAASCTGAAITTLQVCPNTNLATASNISSLALFLYTRPGITFASTPSSGGMASNAALSDVNYSQKPGIYIAYMGLLSGSSTPIYQVTAIGYGGSSTSVAIVQSTYKLGVAATPPTSVLSGQ